MNSHDWDNVFPEVPQSFHETVQRTLDTQIFNKSGRKRVMKKRFPLVLAAVIAALGVTAAAAYVVQWNGKLADHFGANKQQQSQLASDGAVGAVNRAVTKNGVTITAVQTLGDQSGVYVLFDVKAPKGITLSDTNLFEYTNVDINGQPVSWSGSFMNNSDKTGSPTGAANDRYYEVRLNNSEKADWKGKPITFNFTNLQADKGKLDMYNLVEGNWKLSWTLSYLDKTQRFEINKTYDINGHEMLVKSVDLSPLSMTLNIGGNGLKQLIDDSELKKCGGLLTCSLKLKGGTSFTEFDGNKHETPGEILPGNENWTDTTYTRTSPFGKILKVNQVTGLTLTFPWEKANNTVTVPLS